MEPHIFIHTGSNIISGICFIWIAYFLHKFAYVIQFNKEEEQETKALSVLWSLLNRYVELFRLLSIVFLSCGLGHVAESIAKWDKNPLDIDIIHLATATLGVVLCFHLYGIISSNRRI